MVIGECSLANLIFLSFDIYKLPDASSKLLDFIAVCHVISGGIAIMLHAIASDFRDKEDALQYYTTLYHEADYFITRNVKDYKPAFKFLPVSTPEDFLSSLG